MRDSNKLIAEFMGTSIGYGNDYYTNDKFPYNTSWDWLMPVVMKISSKLNKPLDEIISLLTEVNSDNIWDIKSLYSAVVEFIKEQNKD